jgi:hypothetical protein
MLGDVELGQCLAKDIITPMDFLNESQQPYGLAHPMVTNMCRFLQSLDADGNPDNGITISPEVREEMVGRMINFHQSIEDFENDPGVISCFDVFNGLSMPHSNMAWCLTSSEDAQQHMRTYMGDYMPGYMDNHMNFVDTDIDGDGDVEQPMNGYVGNNMNNHMGMCW